MARADRTLVEDLFSDGHVQVPTCFHPTNLFIGVAFIAVSIVLAAMSNKMAVKSRISDHDTKKKEDSSY